MITTDQFESKSPPDVQADPTAEAYSKNADQLARWTWARLVVRTDVWGAYGKTTPVTCPAVKDRGKVVLTLLVLARHFTATERRHVRGLHFATAGKNSVVKNVAADIDNHEDGADPAANERNAIHWYERARELGFRPLLYSSDGKGGYHLRILFDREIPLKQAYCFGHWLFRDRADRGLPALEIFPKNFQVKEDGCSWWLRLPGRHYKRPVWSKVWNGSEWLEGEAAVEFILSLQGDNPELIPAEAAPPEQPGDAPKDNGKKTGGPFTYTAWGDDATRLLDALTYVPGVDDYQRWLEVGMALHNLDSPMAFRMWCNWSSGSTKYTEKACREKWATFTRGGGLTIATIFKWAKDNGWTYPNGTTHKDAGGKPKPPPAAPTPDKERCGEPQTGAEIILEFFGSIYSPQFKRGTEINCVDGSPMTMNVACRLPTSDLIDRLASATNVPRFKGGGINRDALPGFFRKWAPVAWGDLLKDLPEEDVATLGNEAPAREQFRQLVREALFTECTLAQTIAGGAITHAERRSLVSWCQMFAATGRWKDVRSKCIWVKLVDVGAPQPALSIAIRHELFAQQGADRRLRELGPRRFARLADRYDVGRADGDERPGGVRAIVLDRGFVEDLTQGVPTEGWHHDAGRMV